MSLWGATVITNLISAIPWIGTDIVEFKKSPIFRVKDYLLFPASLLTSPPRRYYSVARNLPKIGVINLKSRSNRSKRLPEDEYLLVPSSFLAFLVGVVDGDGYIKTHKSTQDYINLGLTISIHLDDIALLNYIQSVLKIGKIHTYPKWKSPTARLVFNKTDLQEILFPLLLHHGIFFLTERRRAQYNMAMYIFNNNIKKYSELPKVAPILYKLPTNAEGYCNLSFFNNWIVGFTVAEGSFLVKSNNDGCFQLRQKMEINLFESFKLIFNTSRKIDTTHNFSQFSVSSKGDIQNVINFFSFSGNHPLVGLKNIQYSIWLDKLRNSSRYKKLSFPSQSPALPR